MVSYGGYTKGQWIVDVKHNGEYRTWLVVHDLKKVFVDNKSTNHLKQSVKKLNYKKNVFEHNLNLSILKLIQKILNLFLH